MLLRNSSQKVPKASLTSFQFRLGDASARKLFIWTSQIIIVKGSYEFLADLSRLKKEFDRFDSLIWLLNAAVTSIAIYSAFLLLGLPAFTKFYWQDFLPLAQSPAMLSILLGAVIATFVKKRTRSDLFGRLGPELSEKVKTAYDNRDIFTLPMQSLAMDVKNRLRKVKSSQFLNWRRVHVRIGLTALLLGAAIFIAHSQISADISPADFRSISDLKDKALGLFQNQSNPQNPKINLSGNIYGKPSLAVLNETKLQLQLYPGTLAGLMPVKSEPQNNLFSQSPPGEVKAVPTELYIESLPPENREIIKRYFEALAKG
jgi:hypothetical protein